METVFNMDTVWRLITPVLNEYTHMHMYEREGGKAVDRHWRDLIVCAVCILKDKLK